MKNTLAVPVGYQAVQTVGKGMEQPVGTDRLTSSQLLVLEAQEVQMVLGAPAAIRVSRLGATSRWCPLSPCMTRQAFVRHNRASYSNKQCAIRPGNSDNKARKKEGRRMTVSRHQPNIIGLFQVSRAQHWPRDECSLLIQRCISTTWIAIGAITDPLGRARGS
jgi:hypothetical protein